MKLLPINDHPSNLDPEACLVAEDRIGRWSIYRVKTGFVAIVAHKAVEGVFSTEREVRELIEELVPSGPSSLSETFSPESTRRDGPVLREGAENV
jgi:hypothetical protein